MKLYSYCLRYDTGAAPNPFWGICTLAICKPQIRKTAEKKDWIIGLGSSHSPIGDTSDCVVYAMQVTDKKTMREYDDYCRTYSPDKIPDWQNRDYRRHVGDCIYDYSHGEPPKMRWGVHEEQNRKRDLGGVYVLISDHFYYFGDKPVKLCDDLKPIIHDTRGHKSIANQPYLEKFLSWIADWGYVPNVLYGEPQLKLEFALDHDVRSQCARRDLEDEEE